MKSIIYTVYRNGLAGLSNLVMSLELGVVLSCLTDRVLVLKGNSTPPANVVQYDGIVHNRYPSRITDLVDLGVPWIDADKINLAAYAPHEICGVPAWDCVFYFPAHLSTESDDFRAFAGRRRTYITIGEDLQNVPALSFSGGPSSETLSFFSYFFYLDRAAQLQAHDALLRCSPKPEFSALAGRVARDLGAFNAVHIRRGDFKRTAGVTTLDRTPAEAIETLDHHFARNDRLVILTDEAADPFFDEIKAAYGNHLFLDHHILENHGSEFLDLPAHDSIALAYLSQLVAAEARDFVGSMTSTFTSLIQRMRGNGGKDEPFKFLWNELPDPGDEIELGRHPIGDSIPLEKGIMVEQHDGPYSWNRYNERLNPAWMREWPEGFLNETAMADRARGREVATPATAHATAAVPDADGGRFTISFLDGCVAASSNRKDVTDSLKQLFELMGSPSDAAPIAEVRIEAVGDRAELSVDGHPVGQGPTASGLLRDSYREIVCRFIERHPDLVWLHAGCAASAAGAVVLPGAWGRGKSSLVMELYDRGWSFLSDDIAPLDPAEGTVIPFPGTPQIRSGAERELPREKLGNLAKSAVALDPARVAEGPTPLSMIVFPRYAKGATSKLTPISPGQAVGELLENCLSFTKNEDATIRRLCAVVGALPVYGLRFGNAADAAQLLIDAHRSAAANASAKGLRDHSHEVDMGMTQGELSIDVEVTLDGGLRYASVLPSDSPILHDLYVALASAHRPDPKRPGILLQLPLDAGQAACSFMSTSVVAVTTRPPVLIQQQPVSGVQGADALNTGAPAHVRIDDFLTPDENKQLLDYALANEPGFEGSTVSTAIEDYRRSRVLHAIKESRWRDIFLSRLELHLPHIASALNTPNFHIVESEIQLTASNDGDYFKPHADVCRDMEVMADREITYVYYLHRTPRPYSGGDLLLYHGEPGQPVYDSGRAVEAIAPRNNCLVAFASNLWHEVELVRCQSAEFADSRFTVNGWLRRKAS